jgi:serine/threonine protein phosphatase 1
MTNPKACVEVKHLPPNRRGRDFIVGDLHGCFDELYTLLEKARFDVAKDRLFAVGDLGDRGPSSWECFQLLNEPWFYSVMGNHDEVLMYAICATLSAPSKDAAWIDCVEHKDVYYQVLEQNGGKWALDILKSFWKRGKMEAIAIKLMETPTILTVGSDRVERFNIVHSGVYRPDVMNVTDEMIDNNMFEDQEDWQVHMLQSRWALRLPESRDERPLVHDGLSTTYCGHTPMPRAFKAHSHYFIDTGAGHKAGSEIALRMTLIDHRADIKYSNITDNPNDSKFFAYLKKAFVSDSNIHREVNSSSYR